MRISGIEPSSVILRQTKSNLEIKLEKENWQF